MAESTWERRERQLLDAVIRIEQTGNGEFGNERLADETGLDLRDVELGVDGLVRAGYLDAIDTKTSSADPIGSWYIRRATEKARRAAGQWPSEDAYQALVDLLEERIEAADDPEVRGKLRALLTGVQGVGKGVATAVLSAYIERRLGV